MELPWNWLMRGCARRWIHESLPEPGTIELSWDHWSLPVSKWARVLGLWEPPGAAGNS